MNLKPIRDLLSLLSILGPEGHVVAEELKDHGGLAVASVAVLINRGRALVVGLLSELDSLLLLTDDLVEENGVVQDETKGSWPGWLDLLLGNLHGVLVALLGLVGWLALVAVWLALADVPVVVGLELLIEDTALGALGSWEKGGVDEADELVAVLLELAKDGLLVLIELLDAGLVATVVLVLDDGGDHPEAVTAGANDVLVGDGEEVALITVEVRVELDNLLHHIDHILVAISLIEDLSHEKRDVAFGRHSPK